MLATLAAALAGGLRLPYAAQKPAQLDDARDGLTVHGVATRQPSVPALLVPGVPVELSVTAVTAAVARLAPNRHLLRLDDVAPTGRTDAIAAGIDDAARSLRVATVAAARLLELPAQLAGNGVEITAVDPGPAAGLLQPDDLLQQVDSQPVGTVDDLQAVRGTVRPGDTVTVVVQRNGRRLEVPVAVWAGTDGTSELGIWGRGVGETVIGPLHVTTTAPAVGGPSGGLALALAIIDLCAAASGRIARPVAATAELDPAGRTYPVGGITAKVHACRRAGITRLLVAPANRREAADAAAGHLQVQEVASLGDAWDAVSD